MLKKRGLSEIVATLLIILLTLIAVGIVWVVVKNVINQGAEQVELGSYTLDLQIQSAKVENGNVVLVVVRRNPGQGEFIGMNFVFSDGKNSEMQRENVSLPEGGMKSFTFTLTKISTSALKTVSVYPIYKLSSGTEKTGGVADSYNVPENKSMGGTGEVQISNFAALGFNGTGRDEYRISSQSSDVVKIKTAIIDPLDVHVGDNQTLTVYVYSPYGIANVTAFTQLDNGNLTLNLEKISNDSGGEFWAKTWQVYDTHVTTYRTTFTARDNSGNQNSVTLTWTDPCSGIVQGQTSTLNGNCVIGASEVSGIDGASLTVPASTTLTLGNGAQFIFNQGQSITMNAAGASITLGSGASFGQGASGTGYLYYTDSDGDGKAPNAVLNTNGGIRAYTNPSTSDCNDNPSTGGSVWSYGYGTDGDSDGYGTSSYGCNNGAGTRTATSGTDCNDGNNRIYITVDGIYHDADGDGYSAGGVNNGVCVGGPITGSCTYYPGASSSEQWIFGTCRNSDCNDVGSSVWYNGYGTDSDGDTYGTGSYGCNGGLSSSAANGGDCCDSDANAHPGATGWYSSPRTTCGGYDYNCDTFETQEETTVSDCQLA